LLSAPFFGISFKTINLPFANALFQQQYLLHQKRYDEFSFSINLAIGLSDLLQQGAQF
jgi:hypothetical protein